MTESLGSSRSAAKLLVAVIPDMRDTNPYQSLLAAALDDRDLSVRFPDEFDGRRPLLKALVSGEFDVLHIDWIHPYVVGSSPLKSAVRGFVFVTKVVLARLLGKRVVWTVHNINSHDSGVARVERAVGRALAFASHRLIVHHPPAREIVRSRFRVSSPAKVLVAPHGSYIDAYRGPERKRPPGDGSDPLVFLSFGLVRRYKRLAELIEAFSRVESPDVRLSIVGEALDPDYAEELRRLAEPDDRITLQLKRVDEGSVASVFADADVAAINQREILTSGSLVLAMSMGLPVLAVDTPHATFLLGDDGSGGVIYPPGDPESLANAIGRLTANRAKLADMGRENTVRIASFTWAGMAEIFERAYRP